jgi:hypothetical protein
VSGASLLLVTRDSSSVPRNSFDSLNHHVESWLLFELLDSIENIAIDDGCDDDLKQRHNRARLKVKSGRWAQSPRLLAWLCAF